MKSREGIMKLIKSYDHLRQHNRFVKAKGHGYMHHWTAPDKAILDEVENSASDAERRTYLAHREKLERIYYC